MVSWWLHICSFIVCKSSMATLIRICPKFISASNLAVCTNTNDEFSLVIVGLSLSSSSFCCFAWSSLRAALEATAAADMVAIYRIFRKSWWWPRPLWFAFICNRMFILSFFYLFFWCICFIISKFSFIFFTTITTVIFVVFDFHFFTCSMSFIVFFVISSGMGISLKACSSPSFFEIFLRNIIGSRDPFFASSDIAFTLSIRFFSRSINSLVVSLSSSFCLSSLDEVVGGGGGDGGGEVEFEPLSAFHVSSSKRF